MTDSPLSQPAASSPSDIGGGSIFGPIHLTRAIILITGILCAIAFYYAARWIAFPGEPGFGGSMAQSKALMPFLVAIALLVICTIVATVIAGRRWFMAGLMTATAGLTTWSVRGGIMTHVLFNAQTSGSNQLVFLQMFGELIVFFGVIAALWNLIWINSSAVIGTKRSTAGRLSKSGAAERMAVGFLFGRAGSIVWQKERRHEVLTAEADDEGRSTGAALLAQTALMLILMMLFVATPLKKQVLTSVFLAGMISTALAEYFFADRKAGRWYWVAPLAIGTLGYFAGYLYPAGMETGDLQGVFAPLARVLPLDYASMGCAGVLFGYWWMEPDPVPEPASDAEAAKLLAAEPANPPATPA